MNEEGVIRGAASRAQPSQRLFDALDERYGLRGTTIRDLGGSANLNLLRAEGRDHYVVRVYRPWVTRARLTDLQSVRRHLDLNGVPSPVPIPTLDGESWILVDGRLVEVEPYVEQNANMDSWARIEVGLPLLGRIHTLLQPLVVSADGRNAPAANNIEPDVMLAGVLRGIQRIRRWDASTLELQLAGTSEELARLIDHEERAFRGLPRQLVHGDYWDNNVFFRDSRIVLVTDLDFMGERARIDDLALTLYYTNSTFHEGRDSDERMRRLRTLVDAYDSGLDEHLWREERAALPLAIARTAVGFIAMIAAVEPEPDARRLAAEMVADISWVQAMVRDLRQWQTAFV